MLKISIITVVKNGMPDLIKAFKSFDEQTYNNKEHVVIFSKSRDDTVKFILSRKKKTRKIFSDSNTGNKFDALNLGMKKCTGDIIGILHADDQFYNKNILLKVANSIKNNNFLYGNIIIHKNNKIIRDWKANKFNVKQIKYGWMPPHVSCFVQKKFLSIIGFYNPKYKISSDYDFLIRSMKNKKFSPVYLNNYLVKMKSGGDSTKISNLYKKFKEDYIIIKNNNISIPIFTLLIKIFRKISQFF